LILFLSYKKIDMKKVAELFTHPVFYKFTHKIIGMYTTFYFGLAKN